MGNLHPRLLQRGDRVELTRRNRVVLFSFTTSVFQRTVHHHNPGRIGRVLP